MANSSRWVMSTSPSTVSPCPRRRPSSWARATAAPAAAGSCTARSSPGWRSRRAQKSNYRAVVDPEKCISCGLCIKRCPVKAIAESENENGKVKVNRDNASAAECALLRAQPTRSGRRRYLKKSGSTFPPAWRNGKRGAWRIWRRRSSAVAQRPPVRNDLAVDPNNNMMQRIINEQS